jgi:hypothetical protein
VLCFGAIFPPFPVFFTDGSVMQAMSIDERDESNQTSSCVDDVFFILKKSATRAVSTSDMDVITSIVNLMNQSLELDYLNSIQKRLVAAFVANDMKDAKIEYMVRTVTDDLHRTSS